MKRFLLSFLALLSLLVFSLVGAGVVSHRLALQRQNRLRTDVAPRGGRYIPAGDAEIFLQESGDPKATPVLFVGGTGAWSGNWIAELKIAAEAGFHGVAIDLPPFGYSEKPALDYSRANQSARILAVMQSLGAKKVILVAHSFAAAPMLTAAATAPEKVGAALLIDPALGWSTPEATVAPEPSLALRMLMSVRSFKLALAGVATHPGMQRTLLQRVLYKKEMATEEVVDVFARQMNVRGKSEEMSAWLADLLTLPDGEFIEHPDFFEKVKAPVTVVWGSEDTITPLWQGEKLVRLLPNAELVLLKGVGHVPQIEDPPAFRNALRIFLGKLGSP